MKHPHKQYPKKFPKDFLWGTSTSAHQVEGDNVHNDWWHYEQTGKVKYKSGKACDSYNRYEEDFDLAQMINNNAHRMSIEWSRLEPRKGEWDYSEVEHYRNVLLALKKRNIKVILTLHHFTLPFWFSQIGGFEKISNVRYFSRYVRFVTEQFADLVDMWITINEPGVYVYEGYQIGKWPPFKKSLWLSIKVYINLIIAHRSAYKKIHRSDKSSSDDKTQVGIAQNTLSFAAYRKHGLIDQLAVWIADKVVNHGFYILSGKNTHDFLGINYYFRVRLRRKKGTLKIVQDDISQQGREISSVGWEIYPHGLFDVLMDFRDYGRPIIITENGVSTDNDDKRQRFLVAHLNEVYHALKGGVDIRGFLYWSLLDNFEWSLGLKPNFGLVEVNFRTYKRNLLKSGKIYAEIIKANGIEHKMFRLLGHEAKL